MLILTRKPGESIYIGDDVKVTIVEIKGHQIRVGIDAPKDRRIYREEIFLQILEENKQAAEAAKTSAESLEGLPSFGAGSRSKGLAALSSGKGAVKSSTDPQVVVRKKKKSDE